jgi:hypothetical protein
LIAANSVYTTMITDSRHIEQLLRAVGDQLTAAGAPCAIVIIGGAAMNLGGFVSRPTRDVDVLALVTAGRIGPAEPLPARLRDAIATVARDYRLPADWMNTGPARQLRTGLPPGLETRLEWRQYGALQVGLVSREDLVAFKLYAAADQTGPGSVHVTDLLALLPTAAELGRAAEWIRTQDPTPEFHGVLERVIAHVLGRAQ